MRSSISSSLFAAALMALPGQALAQGIPPQVDPAQPTPDEFQAPYRSALNHYKAGEYEDAIRQLRAAYKIRPWPRLLYNLGQAHRKLGHTREAVDHFELYLRTDPMISDEVRAEVEGYLATLRTKLPRPPVAEPQIQFVVVPATPVYKRWRFWGILGVAAAGTTAAVAGILATRSKYPDGTAEISPVWSLRF